MFENVSTLIINRLKKSSIAYKSTDPNEQGKNIILYSDDSEFSEPPYVVVKPEIGVREKTRRYRIIVHMEKGNFNALEDYTLKELDSLLLKDYLIDEEGSRFKLHVSGYTDILPEPTDNTYFMERIYFTPLTIR